MSVSIRELSKVYDTQKALDAVSFDLHPGEVLGFLGPNGAGKSTTMKIMTGFLSPTSGNVYLGDFNVREHPLEIRKRVGYLPEHNPLYLDLYVWEFLHFVARIYRLPRSERKDRIATVIARTGLDREQHKKIGMLSKGYRQRVGLCQALIHDPEVLILDEPTSGLDPNQIVDIRALIREVGQQKTVIFSSHILSEVEALADRVVIINQGRIVADEAVSTLREHRENEQQIDLELADSGFEVAPITKLPGVKAVQSLDERHFRIQAQLDQDPRQALFAEVVRQGHVMLALSRQRYSLEDAFRSLTQDRTEPSDSV